MQWSVIVIIASLLAGASAEAGAAVEEKSPGVMTGAGDGTPVVPKQAAAPVPKGKSSQVEVRLDLLEAMERLPERGLKVSPRQGGASGEEPADATPERE